MKQNYLARFFGWTLVLLFTSTAALAQPKGTITGTVLDNKKQPIIGAAVVVRGTTNGGATDINGKFKIEGVKPGTAAVQASYLGYRSATINVTVEAGKTTNMTFALEEDVQMLEEAVVVGYGTTQTRDLTGSVVAIQSKTFQQGNFASPEQMIMGKSAGVQVSAAGGAPGSGSQIRIRGTSSIGANNDPLFVIDGVPVESGGIAGAANPLSLINPDDIESFTILKDASAAAIYGSRAANGVIIITTKKGKSGDKFTAQVSSNLSVKQIARRVNSLSADQYRDLVNSSGDSGLIARLGASGFTNWQDEIYQLGRISDLNVGFTGGIKNLPYRLSLERYDETGNLRTGNFERTGASLNLNPTFFKNRLKVDANLKYFNTQSRFANQGAIGSAITFDPTKPVRVDTGRFDGYFEWTQGDGSPDDLAPKNPVGMLNQRRDISSVNRFIGGVLLDYKVDAVPGLNVYLNVGGDWSRGSGTITVDSTSAVEYRRQGRFNEYREEKNNRMVEAYFRYAKDIPDYTSKFDFTGGYTFQEWSTFRPVFQDLDLRGDTETVAPEFPTFFDNALVSYFGRLNYSYNDRYLITATVRADGSSRFAPENRWGFFPSVAFAWRMSEEDFFRRMKNLSTLKFRTGIGSTGQQDVGLNYGYMAFWNQSTPTASMQLGNQFFSMWRPGGYDANLRWESTTTYNAAFDFGFFNNKIYGTLEWYHRDTRDLLNFIEVPAGTNFTNRVLTNVGNMTNTGLELTLNYVAVDRKDLTVEIGANGTFNRNEVTNLFGSAALNEAGILFGPGISGGTGNRVQRLVVGRPLNTFYLFEQLYDENGKPIEGAYRDVNGDGQITDADLVIHDKSAQPQYFFAFFGNVRYKKWNGGFSLRGEIGRYVYNNVNSNFGHLDATGISNTWSSNVVENYLSTNFVRPQYLSDYYLEKANFLRLDNLFVGYNFGSLFNSRVATRASFMIQNAFVLSNYSGVDPEVANGVDNNLYPRARVYTVNLNFTF
ncbi:MAG: SusC/RagA family protein [Sphingobacteriaceae bacterium]|nr:SusC/RagA family protein [Sphingobacteriaceae bacterium]